MRTRLKYALRRACGWLAGTAAAQMPGMAPMGPMPRTISVSGSGTVDATPDIANLTLAVQRRDTNMEVARDATVKVSKAFLALCTKLGIKENKIRTSGLTIQPEYRWDEKQNQQVFTGYFVQRQLQVEINDLDKLGDVIEGAIDAGVNEVSPPAAGQQQEEGADPGCAGGGDGGREGECGADCFDAWA